VASVCSDRVLKLVALIISVRPLHSLGQATRWTLHMLELNVWLQRETPSKVDLDRRQELCSRVEDCMKSGLCQCYIHNLSVLPFGSFVAGLTCPSGDLDLSIEGVLMYNYIGLESTHKGWVLLLPITPLPSQTLPMNASGDPRTPLSTTLLSK